MDITSALALAKQGFRIFPIQRNSKRPAIADNLNKATTSAPQIEAWCSEFPDCNFGIATGGDVFVIDADVKDGRNGLPSLAALQMLYDVDSTLTVETPSGGKHLYLRKPASHPLVSNADKVPGHPGLDIRAEGGFVVAPGSTIDGRAYRTLDNSPLAHAPDCIIDMLRQPMAARQAAPATELDLPHHIERARNFLVHFAPEATMGAGGDETTFSVAAELRALGVSEETALDLMLEHWNENKASPPWQPDELAIKVENAFRYGQGAPGGKTAAGEFDILEIDCGEPPAKGDDRDTSAQTPKKEPRVVRACDFAPMETPIRQFLVADLIPHKNVTILGGDGATGKSLLAMQLAVAAATDTMWIGQKVRQGPTLYFSAEDDEDETHIRLKDICRGQDLGLAEVKDVHIALMAGEDALLATEHVPGAAMKKTPLFGRLREWMAAVRPVLLVLDNLADIFGGNENVKALARQFVGMLRGLAIEFDCSVVLLAHPSQSGMATGSGTSGNSAWNNSVRSRLYLQRDKTADGVEHDTARRILEVKKANYSATGQTIEMRWERGCFVTTDIPDMDGFDLGGADPETKLQRAERVFLGLVRKFNIERRYVSPSPSPSYAPALFAKHADSRGVGKDLLEVAMNNLLSRREIRVDVVGPPSRQRQVIVISNGET